MPSKTEEYLALAQRTANGLTRYWESWTDYLTTASRLYKYPFADQLMIYAQRPDATACAEFDIWRNRMNRYVRRGSKGIALLDESSGFPRLHYVFDVSDTGVRRNSRDPEMWQYNDDLKQPVSEMLSKTYGISGERVSQQLADVAGKLVADYWDNNGGDIRAIVDGSLLMDYDEAGVEMQFKSAAAISVTYTLLERCGFEPAGWFDKDDFRAIHEFSTPDSVYALGAAVSDMSREVLRNIERTVKTTIRRRNAERSQYEYEQQKRDLLDRRGLPAPEPDPEPAPEAAGQVRQAAPDVPERPSPGAVQHDAPEREPVPAPDGGGADGREPDAADHEAASETEPGPGQGAESDGVGAAHEQPAGTVRGTGADGTDLQLSFFDAHIPTEAEQIETIDRAESEKTPSAFVLSQAEIENELRKHGSGFTGGKQRIMALYQTQPDRKLRAKALAKEYGIGGHSHDYLDGSRGFVNHDGRGMEFDHYPEHKKFTLSWTQVEKYIDLMIQSDRYLTDKEKEHYTPPVSAEPDATLTHAKNLIREFCQEEYDSEPDFSDLSKIGVAYTNATDENIPIQVNVDLVGYRVERYLGEVLIDERQYESLEELTETELEALDFSELVSVTDEELEHYHNKAEEHSALLPLDAATEYNTLKEQHPDALVGFEQGGQFEFYGEDARKVCELVGGKLLEKETELGTVPVTGFPRDQWAYRAKQLWQCGENIYLAGLNEDGTHHQTKYLRREDYLPLGATIHMEGRAFRVDTVNFDKGSVSLQDVALAEMRIPVFREEPLALVRELYEEQDMMESPLPDYKVGDNVVVELPTRTIEGKVGYVGETDVRIDTSTHGQSWDNEVINKQQFEEGLRQNEPNSTRPVRTEKTVAVYPAKENNLPFDIVIQTIHNYFFAKAIDQVRPGGIVAFVTSRYTMDSKDSTARKHMAERADLLGAIRLPNNAFRANAGTDVVSDIIFLQKRDRPIDHEPDWVQLGKTEDGFAINQYFADHPEMVLGELTTESTQYGREDLTVAPIEGTSLADQLAEAVQHIEGNYTAVEIAAPDVADAEAQRKTLPADPTVKNFSYTVVDGEIYYRENSIMTQIELSDNAKGRVAGMVELRQTVNELIDQQLNDFPDEDIKASQAKLNATYDAFTAKYGLLNDRKNGRLFEQDSSYYLLCSLENLDEQGQLKSKAAMFTKRTIRPECTVTSVDTPSEALAVSIGEHGKVDLPYMAELLGTPGEYGRITTELSGVIFKDPAADPTDPEAGWQMADEYLSGDVRAKLRMAQFAAETNPEFSVNVEALTKAQPRELEASEIDVRLGATWLDPDIIQKFMTETFQIPYYLRHAVKVRYSPYTAEWRVEGKTATGRGDIISSETYGTSRANAYKILEETLNLKDVRIYDTIEDADGKPKRVLNKRETMLAQQKQQVIKDAFANWVWQDPQRRIALVKQYNELFNSTRPREYDGSHIHFVGMNPEITLREHQRNAIAHVLYGGNTLLAHEVGAGKTYEMAASAMEAKRLGLCQKSLFVVPNHLTEQWASEFLNLYPNAKLLVARRKDFETANRKKFCARIATGDYDAVIIGHSQFERIPLSFERQERIIQEQIYETLAAINELKVHAGENFSIKQMEKTRKTLETKLEKLRSDERKDDVITFEQLGVDRLFVDESHFYKNLFLTTKMRNVAGLSTSEAQKSSDMFGKCRYLDEITGGRGVVFATGTPVSNSMTELYTVMRYLQYSTLQQKKLTHFDCWASTFGETTTAIELAPEGTGYRARTRFAKFFNLPELMSMFKEVADIKTSDQLHLPVPEAKFETVVAKPSEIQKEMVQELSKRAAEIHSGTVDASVDNMLCVTNDGRKIGLDVRLMNPMLPDDPNSKLNVCVRNVLKIWDEGKDQKLTQLLFCDLSTPKNDGNFNVYDDIRKKLVAAGVPENEIEFIHNADTEAKKAALFSKVRSGDVRVLLGSTAKMGAGTNVQSRLVAVHHLDVGWKPSDMTQRNGRIIRQGNMNKEVKVFNYVTEGTFDSYLFQTLENKQRFISQIMTSKSPVRSCEDVDEQALSYAEIKALCAGNPLIKEKMDLDVQVAKLKVLKADHQSQKFRLQDKLLTKFPADIRETNAYIAGVKADAQLAAAHPQVQEGFCGMTIKGVTYDEKKTAGERLVLACSELPNAEEKVIGSYRGFELSLRFDTFRSEYQAILKGERRYPVALGTDPLGNIIRLDNSLNNFPERINSAENELATLHQQQAAAQIEVEKPFPQEEELAEKSARLAELNAQLDVDEKNHEPEQDEEEQEDAPRRPSVLAALEEKSDKPEPVKPFRSYYDKDGDAR